MLTKLRGMLPRVVPPGWVKGQSRHREKPSQEGFRPFGFRQTRHEFKQNPFRDGSLAVHDQGFQLGLNGGMTGRTERVNPDGGVNEIYEAYAYAAVGGAGRG